jgi:hypothetical protein
MDWITDRLPTEADGDEDGYVIVSNATQRKWYGMHFMLVSCGQSWLPFPTPAAMPAPESAAPATPAPQPRRFVSITRTVYGAVHTIDAVADDGTAWWMVPGEADWTQLPALPDREVG